LVPGGIAKRVGAISAAAFVLASIAAPAGGAQDPESIELVDLEQHVRQVATLASASVVTVVAVHEFPELAAGSGEGPGAVSSSVGGNAGRLEATVGSGIVINEDGDIVTMLSVIGEGGDYQITTASGEVWSAELIGYDRSNRLCLLRSGAKDLKPVKIGSSSSVGPGTMIIIVGRAFGNLPTVSFGAVNERHPWKDSEGSELISMSAPVYPGNNGGAVLNFRGELIGIVSGTLAAVGADSGGSLVKVPQKLPSISSPSGDAQMSFAIPVEALKESLPRLRSRSSEKSAYFGVRVASSSQGAQANGVVLSGVVPDSPAAGAGLRKGDVIFKYNGVGVSSAEELIRLVRRSKAGSPVEIVYLRDGDLRTAKVVLAEISPYELKLLQKRMRGDR